MSSYLQPGDFDLDISDIASTKPIQAEGVVRRLFEHAEGNDYIMPVDWSTGSGFMECARKASYSMIYSRNSGQTSALLYGQAVHKGLETYYRQRAAKEQLNWTSIVNAIEDHMAGSPFTDWRTPEKAVDTLVKYAEKYANEPFEIFDHEGPFVEKPFSYTLCEVEVNSMIQFPRCDLVKDCDPADTEPFYVGKVYLNWTGVIDLALVSKDGHVWPVDHKTSSMGGAQYYESFNLSGQFIGYAAAFRQLLGFTPQGMIGNFLIGRKPSVKGKGTPLDLERELYQYPEWQLDQWQVDMAKIFEDFLHKLSQAYFPSNHTSCQTKYGLCPYFQVCRLPPGERMDYLFSDRFTFNVWNPLTDH